ncbi:exopolysaccharide biosynthesis WecB/TagA/CpsF family protein [Maritimibacter alkaliphilus HTCC2654]|uniref:Undecaprenyl-phosphate galactosephosphotransferase n=1 Tax=Maritimibacter alkaliphilus HTCC2654 TaxID=314271 RepID=A3VF58_9RHOB|nr:WecB/TagA/CpsF family glycosyltransferase [Maritimibacter alkaliphilus]EAQ12973.1 Undecaprenyl-phosphate galactosephosphotransferase [Rhodobacterales bacterium HTCC2654] [Maritimibacter alkaliphilus HTCC2654]TYP79907.1 exopolysaccharide biosynthesis WecB/TagA/CpsF family protein [Maritimibacter alkaliphilus HTCC2654]
MHHDHAAFALPAPEPLTTVRLFDFDVVSESGDRVVDHLLAPGRRRVHFVNAHCINLAARDLSYARALRSADVVLPDGAGIELAFRAVGHRMAENLNGTDFGPRLLAEAAGRGKSVFLFGGRPGTADAAAARLARDIPGLVIAGTRDGYEGARDTEAAIRAINASGADILMVAMGVPLQDQWIADHGDDLTPPLTLGVGALFDFLAGNVSRAPRLLRKVRGEWLWRLAVEPRRMFRRYVIGNPEFLFRTLGLIAPHTIAKRAFDLLVAGAVILALSPLFALTALAIKADTRGPVFFRQTRVGRNGQPFSMLKFRSMAVDAEARRDALLATSDRSGVCFKSRTDPRVTRVGRLLRRYSIDELPQVFNVLTGDMSIVGPRPALPNEVAAYPPRALGRLAVKPGLTGVWQVSGRAEIGFDKMVDMDIAYARTRSVLLDAVLLALTFRAVLTGRGAY